MLIFLIYLNSEYEGESYQRLLASTELVHFSHLSIFTREADRAGDPCGIL